MTHPRVGVRATYRVQLNAGFTFAHAVRIVPYLARLGISHLYVSPVLSAVSGSTHGYDVIDHSRVSGELGGEEGFDLLIDALHAHGMGLVLDIVPNHMAMAAENRWWWDVLEHGPASRYAGYFDVDWAPRGQRRSAIVLPVLPDHYRRVLEAGQIALDRSGGGLVVKHAGRRFPVDPKTIDALISGAAERAGSDELGLIGSALGELPPSTVGDAELVARRQRNAEALTSRLTELAEEPAVARALDAAIASVNGDPDALDSLLERQNYGLASWRVASSDLRYRRFFDIDELIGLRVEDPRVFADTHALVLRWVAGGRVDGLRIDHPDGLRDPADYFGRLRAAAPDAWIVAEKILEADEPLPADWPIDGTTGYRFANLATGVLVDPAAEPSFSELWARVADVGPGWAEIVGEARTEVLSDLLGSDLNRLADLLLAVCEANGRHRDLTRDELWHALRQVAAAMPVYRTYGRSRDGYLSERDGATIARAVATAAEQRPELDPGLFAFLGRVLQLEAPGPLAAELAMRFQQLTPAAMAKGVEDTAFYRHHRFVTLNEVGGDPGRFGTQPSAFHDDLSRLQAESPRGMLALSTHDTKRSADVRARLAVLAEDPAAWQIAVERLFEASVPHRAAPGAPTDADVYLLFQTLVGAWPIDAHRAVAYLAKASREAKLHTSWTDPDAAYDEALESFVRGTLGDSAFRQVVESAVDAVVDAGLRAALAQVALQMTAPGVPDIYQGGELWDLSLVDPDNRRAVDYRSRAALLSEVAELDAAAAWARRDDGTPKLWLIHRLLELRRRRPAAFGPRADYRPITVEGAHAIAAVAFARGDEVVTVVPRLPRRVERSGWSGTELSLPLGRWLDLEGHEFAGRVSVGALVARFPVSVLERVP